MKDKICTITMLRTSLENTLDFISYHLNIGVDHMYLFFDDPKDDAIKVLVGNKNVSCFRCDSKHWLKLSNKTDLSINERQKLNANLALKMAKKKGYDWIAHIDSDELIYTKKPLKKFLFNIPKDVQVLRLRTIEAVAEKNQNKGLFRGVTLFKSMGYLSKFYYSNKKILQKIVPFLKKHEGNLSNIYFRAHSAGKSIIRTNAKIDQIGIHEPVAKKGFKLNYMFVSDAHLLHFDCCNFDSWKLKWFKRYNEIVPLNEICEREAKLLKDFTKSYKSGDSTKIYKLFKKQYFIHPIKKMILRSLGLLKRIKLDKKLFKMPENFEKR